MTWWLPSTWFEDTGKLRRVSEYHIQKEPDNECSPYIYVKIEATAKFRDPSGKLIVLTHITGYDESSYSAIEGCRRKAREYKSN